MGTDNWKILTFCGGGYSLGETGGEAAHTLTTNEMPSHKHGVADTNNTGYVYTRLNVDETDNTVYKTLITGKSGYYQYKDPSKPEMFRLSDSYIGGGNSHNNMPPYLGVYMWIRIA